MIKDLKQYTDELSVVIMNAKRIISQTLPLIVLLAIADEYDITTFDITSGNRERPLPDTRAIYAHILHTRHGYSITKIASLINRHHSSILAMISRYDDLYASDPAFRQHADRIIKNLEKQ